jgi:hypothetical protein
VQGRVAKIKTENIDWPEEEDEEGDEENIDQYSEGAEESNYDEDGSEFENGSENKEYQHTT